MTSVILLKTYFYKGGSSIATITVLNEISDPSFCYFNVIYYTTYKITLCIIYIIVFFLGYIVLYTDRIINHSSSSLDVTQFP